MSCTRLDSAANAFRALVTPKCILEIDYQDEVSLGTV